ncbi:PhzF family phenazine biosynthesis protein [Kutzneria buriramensis]|uniref:Trans-2,3-dihydro-3-hydroxyanthranilate isomerase n=1 Tax=Kutzneria buriramensis TaxID=1045776 RepID=A0A3E0G5Y3_9PSEU|nr:PhzF family phenazine biosynthesis protein [Kutzneria buriramensis]REH17873.1 trans-2,3-dihydro-3-hydroxyanthranilate isomerase [Kutzneria buriramensis]
MIAYHLVDMFADGPLTGCALAVVPDAEHLDDETMAAIARELGTSETAFVLPPTQPEATHRVRIFTPQGESPFGGHSAVGTACMLVRLGRLAPGRLVQQCGERVLPVDADADHATLTATRPLNITKFDATRLAEACSVPPHGLAATAGFGPAFHLMPTDPDSLALAALRPEHPVWRGEKDLFVFAWNPEEHTAHARMFAPGYGMPEDPACASAALALGPWLVDSGLLPADTGCHEYHVRQGIELRRPSTLHGQVQVADGRVVSVTVTGAVLPAASGHLTVPEPARV